MQTVTPRHDAPGKKKKKTCMVDEHDGQASKDPSVPCGMGEDEVEEAEWDNPDEEYKDDDYMTRDIAGGLNRPKDKGALRAKDPVIPNEMLK